MKTVLVSGAAGFIGSHLCDYYLANGHFVIGIDNLLTGSKENIFNLQFGQPNFQFIEADVTRDMWYMEFESAPDLIFHMASPASPKDYQAHPEETLLAGSIATINVLRYAQQIKARVLLASTSEVYGSPQVHPQNETYWGHVNSYGPRCMYDEAKRFQEACAYVYQQKHGADVRIARIFNTYGPRMKANDGRVIPQFINQALTNQPITIHGYGDQTRSFCYIDDLILGLVALMNSNYKEPVNLGNPHEITILKLVREIFALIPESGSAVTLTDRPGDDPENRCPDIFLAKNLLDWQPTVSLAVGLQRTIHFFKQQLNSIPA